MKKFLSLFLCSVFLCGDSLALQTVQSSGDQFKGKSFVSQNTLAGRLQSAGYTTATFIKDFTRGNSVDADFAVGSVTGTFTASRSATTPATWIDETGKVNTTTTSNIPRFQEGYYDATGFHLQKGLMIERASTNVGTYSSTLSNAIWVLDGGLGAKTDTDAGSSSPDGTATAPSYTSGAASGFVSRTATAGAGVYCTSFWIKRKTGTGTINARGCVNDVLTDITSYVKTDKWVRIIIPQTSGAAANPQFLLQLVTNTDAVYVWGLQAEALPYATSLIQTTSAALTRNAESLSFLNASNRTAATESTFIKYAPSWAATSQASAVYLLDSNADIVDLAFVAASDSFQYRPNGTDDAANVALAASDPAIYTSYVMAGISGGATAATNAEIYVDGVSKGSTVTDYTAPTLGTNWYLGSRADATLQIDGIVQAVAILSDSKSTADVLNITNLINGNG